MWIPRLYDQLLAGNGFLRFTSGATPVDLLMVSMAAKPFYPRTCTHVHKHWWNSNEPWRSACCNILIVVSFNHMNLWDLKTKDKGMPYRLANMFSFSFQLFLLKDSQSHWPLSIIEKLHIYFLITLYLEVILKNVLVLLARNLRNENGALRYHIKTILSHS